MRHESFVTLSSALSKAQAPDSKNFSSSGCVSRERLVWQIQAEWFEQHWCSPTKGRGWITGMWGTSTTK